MWYSFSKWSELSFFFFTIFLLQIFLLFYFRNNLEHTSHKFGLYNKQYTKVIFNVKSSTVLSY